MSNTGEFYDHTTYPVTRSTASSAGMRQELDLVEAGFNKLPPMSGNAMRLVKVGSAGTDMTVASLYEDSAGRLLIGINASRTTGTVARSIQTEKADTSAGVSVVRVTNDASGADVVIGKSRGTVVGSSTIVQSGDTVGRVLFVGADGVDMDSALASVNAVVDGTPGSNDMPGALDFYTTPDGAAVPVFRARISAAGNFGLGAAPVSRILELHNTTRAIARIQATQTTGTDAISGIEFHSWDGASVALGASLYHVYSLQSTEPNSVQLNVVRNAAFILKTNNADSMRVDGSGVLTLVKSTSALGYGTGAGGTVTQLTSKATGVTLNRPSGQITMNGAALAAATAVSFTLTNSVIGTTDVVHACIDSAATAGAYSVTVDAVGAGTCQISLRNHTAGSLSEAVVLNFVVLRAATA